MFEIPFDPELVCAVLGLMSKECCSLLANKTCGHSLHHNRPRYFILLETEATHSSIFFLLGQRYHVFLEDKAN